MVETRARRVGRSFSERSGFDWADSSVDSRAMGTLPPGAASPAPKTRRWNADREEGKLRRTERER